MIMEVKKLHKNGALQSKSNMTSYSNGGLSELPDPAYSPNSTTNLSPDVPRRDEVSSPALSCSSSSACSSTCASIESCKNSSSAASRTCVLDISEEVSKHAVRPSPPAAAAATGRPGSGCGSACRSNHNEGHDRTFRENLMVGYRAMKPFERSLNDEELERLFEEGYVSVKDWN